MGIRAEITGMNRDRHCKKKACGHLWRRTKQFGKRKIPPPPPSHISEPKFPQRNLTGSGKAIEKNSNTLNIQIYSTVRMAKGIT